MTYEEFNDFCASLPLTSHVVQWGNSHVWKVAGKVFAIGGWEKSESPAFTFKVSKITFEVLKDLPGLRPAPYFASRGMSWIQQYNRPGLPDEELKECLLDSHRLVSLGFSKKKRKELGLYIEEL